MKRILLTLAVLAAFATGGSTAMAGGWHNGHYHGHGHGGGYYNNYYSGTVVVPAYPYVRNYAAQYRPPVYVQRPVYMAPYPASGFNYYSPGFSISVGGW